MAGPEPKLGRLFFGGGVRPTSNSTDAAATKEREIEITRKTLVILWKVLFILAEFIDLSCQAIKNIKKAKRLKFGQNYFLS